MEGLIGFIIGLVVLIVLFLLGRAIVLWYFRINETVELLQGINAKLALLVKSKKTINEE